MYERFHHLRERPFSLSPDPDYLYPSRVHKEALSYLRYGIEGHAGFIVITGEVGSGKTTLLQTALRTLDRQTSVARLVNTMLNARDLLEAIMLDFGLDPGEGRSKPHLLRDLARYLVDQRAAGRLSLLVIDEAQNLSFSALEEVRMLSNLETEKSKLIQIALIGQPSLRDVMARPELEQLRQRVTVSYHLQALDAEETAAYINHRLRRAAIGAPLEFPREVTRLVYEHSQGVPRKINVISDAILLFAYGDDQHTITEALTREVIAELEGSRVISKPTAPMGPTSFTPPPSSTPPPSDPPKADRPADQPLDLPLHRTSVAAPPVAPPISVSATALPTSILPAAQPSAPLAAAPLRPSTAPPALSSPMTFSAPSTFLPPQVSRPMAPARTAQVAPRAMALAPATASRPAVAASTAFRQEPAGFWARLRRSFFHAVNPAFED